MWSIVFCDFFHNNDYLLFFVLLLYLLLLLFSHIKHFFLIKPSHFQAFLQEFFVLYFGLWIS